LPVPDLNNKTFPINAAKVVGGGSAVNAMFFQRASREDYDMWEKLGNPGWGWNGLKEYFLKGETFYPPPRAQAEEFGIEYRLDLRGTAGPVKVSFPQFIYPQFGEQ
jgi:choline dehydrogenase-like flavoprotein